MKTQVRAKQVLSAVAQRLIAATAIEFLQKMGRMYDRQIPLSRDCRSTVVRALLQNPEAHQQIRIFGHHGSRDVLHVVATDDHGRISADAFSGRLQGTKYITTIASGIEELNQVMVIDVPHFLRQYTTQLEIAAAPDLKNLKLDRWKDHSSDNWVIQLKDSEGNQVGDTIVVYRRDEAMSIKKDDIRFGLEPDDAESRFGFDLPPEFEKQCRALVRMVQMNPRKLKLIPSQGPQQILVDAQNVKLITTITARGERGTCGSLPIVRWLKSGLARLKMGTREIKYKDLK